MKRFKLDFEIKFGERVITAGTVKGKRLEEVKTKTWRLAMDTAIKFANGQDIDNVYIYVIIEYDGEYFDSDELFGKVTNGMFVPDFWGC